MLSLWCLIRIVVISVVEKGGLQSVSKQAGRVPGTYVNTMLHSSWTIYQSFKWSCKHFWYFSENSQVTVCQPMVNTHKNPQFDVQWRRKLYSVHSSAEILHSCETSTDVEQLNSVIDQLWGSTAVDQLCWR